jgi:protein ATS1
MVVTLLASGSNGHGQLANGTIDDSHLFSTCVFRPHTESKTTIVPQKILQIASGGNHTLALVEVDSNPGTNTQLWGCGDASLGQLGPLSGGDVPVFIPIDLELQESELVDYYPRLICASWQTTYVVLSCPGKSDRLLSMGSDDFGDLGIGKPKKKGRTPVGPFRVKFNHLSVDGISLGDLPLSIDSIETGQHHVILHMKICFGGGNYREILVGWGTARHGELGSLNNTTTKTSFLPIPQIIENVKAEEISSFSLGNQHSAFLLKSKEVACIGSNKRGQANGLGEVGDVTHVGCTWNGTYLLRSDPDGSTCVYATGNHSKGQLGRTLSFNSSDSVPTLAPVEFPFPISSRRLLKLACGSEHVLALFSVPSQKTQTEVWGWGWNEHGNLGNNSTEDVLLPVRIWPPETSQDDNLKELDGKKVVDIWAGCGTSWIAVEE